MDTKKIVTTILMQILKISYVQFFVSCLPSFFRTYGVCTKTVHFFDKISSTTINLPPTQPSREGMNQESDLIKLHLGGLAAVSFINIFALIDNILCVS